MILFLFCILQVQVLCLLMSSISYDRKIKRLKRLLERAEMNYYKSQGLNLFFPHSLNELLHSDDMED